MKHIDIKAVVQFFLISFSATYLSNPNVRFLAVLGLLVGLESRYGGKP